MGRAGLLVVGLNPYRYLRNQRPLPARPKAGGSAGNFRLICERVPAVSTMRRLAGAGGFEPPNDGTKIRCLTTWRRPNAGPI
jgi:hypothetical protein